MTGIKVLGIMEHRTKGKIHYEWGITVTGRRTTVNIVLNKIRLRSEGSEVGEVIKRLTIQSKGREWAKHGRWNFQNAYLN